MFTRDRLRTDYRLAEIASIENGIVLQGITETPHYDLGPHDIAQDRIVTTAQGELAARIRARLGVTDPEATVTIEEIITGYWLGDVTSDTSYEMEIRCGEHWLLFEDHYNNLTVLLDWLDVKPTRSITHHTGVK